MEWEELFFFCLFVCFFNQLHIQLSSKDSQMVEVQLKKCLTSLAIREMKIKATLRFHLIPDRMAKNNSINNNLYRQGCGARGMLLHFWWEYKFVHYHSSS